MSAADESLARAEELLARLETARARLEATDDPEQALEVLGELAALAKAVETELELARRGGDGEPARTTPSSEPGEPSEPGAPEADAPDA